MAKKKNKLLSGYYDANTGTRITNANIVEDSSGWKIEKNKLDNLNTSTTLSSKEPTSKVRSKVMAPAPQVKMTIDSINNKINTNINQKIINGGIENEIHNMNMAHILETNDKKIDLSGKDKRGGTTPVSNYVDTGKKYGDYYYDNYETYKDVPIYENKGKYYLKTASGYQPIGRLDKNGNVKTNIDINSVENDNNNILDKTSFNKNEKIDILNKYEEDKKELEKAKKLGYKDNLTKITTQEYDNAQETFKKLQKDYKLSDKELETYIKNGELPVKKLAIYGDSMNAIKQEADQYRLKLDMGKIKQYDQKGFDISKQIYMDTNNMSDDEKQQYISYITGKKDPTQKSESSFFKTPLAFVDGYQFGDINKTVEGTFKNAGNTLVRGALNLGEGMLDTGENILGSAAEYRGDAKGETKKDVKIFNNNTWYTGYKKGNQNYWYDAKNDLLYDEDWNLIPSFNLDRFEKRYNYSDSMAEFGRKLKVHSNEEITDRFMKDFLNDDMYRRESVLGTKSEAMLESMGQALPLMGAGATVGGLYGEGAAVATTSGLTFASTYGNAKTEAIRNGATEKEAMQTAFVQATAETISEQFFDAIPGAKSAGWGEKLVGKVGNSVEKYMGSKTAKIVTKALDISGEGFEEIISNMLTAGGNDIVHFIDKDFTYGMENQSGNILDDMTKAMTSQDSMDSFISAIITSAILNAGSTKINSSKENQIINEIVRTYAKEYNMSIDEAKNRLKINGDNIEFDTSNINQTQNTPNLPNNSVVEQRNINNNINNQVSENVQNSMVRTQNNNKVNPPISTTFLNSAKENNYNSNSEVIRNANSIMLKRGIEGRFDSKFFTNNSENALWRKDENGKRSVIFNPNADENAIFQNVVIHEMVHDVLSSKNNADVLNVEDILDFVSKTSGYESARMNLEETYSKVYDRNSDQFKEMVDEEVIATVLGNKLGSQEYINRLNGQKPNLARRIYNWIVNKLDSLSKALGHQSEKAYWRDVANRFEKAFNGEYNSDLNDNTKYMMTSVKGMNNGINTDNKNFNTYQKYKNGIEEPDNSSFSLKEQVEIARKEFMDSKEKYGFDEKTKELQKKYNKLLTKLNQTENPVQKDIRPQIEKDVDGIVKDLLRTMEQDIIDDQFIDESIEETKYYKDNYIDETDEDILEELGIDQDEAYRRNRELTDEIYDKLMNKLKDEGISIRYDKNGNAIYDRQELAIKGYNELLDYLDDKNINYEVSRSSEAGYVPSIYIKNSDGEVILRIANHKNHNLSDYDIQVDEKYNKLFSDKEYANWKEKIVPKIEENFEKFEWYDKDNQKYSQKSQTWDEFVENNFKSSGTRTKFSEIKAPINPNAITNQNKVKPPIAKEYQKNTIEEKIEKSNIPDVLKISGDNLIEQSSNLTNDDIAKILTEEPETENTKNKRKLAILGAQLLDKGLVFENLSLKTKNRDLMGKWDYTLTSEARGQNVIGNGHYEFDSETKTKKQTSKSLYDIQKEVNNSGNTKEFYEYLYHKHNIDRMSLKDKYGIDNKPVFGDNIDAEYSKNIVNEYEENYPQFTDYAQDVYDYLNADRQELIKSGVITQELADYWQEMYPHYVPIRREDTFGNAIDVPLDTKRTSVNAPIKKAKGGNQNILPLFDTIAKRTLQTYRAVAKNNFGIELKNTLNSSIDITDTNVDDIINNIDFQDELLTKGKNGSNPTFTVFENGKKVTFEITKDMYDALKPVSESSILSKTFKPFNKVMSIYRGILTEYNPVFMLTNSIKDAQDVLINSQHSTKTYKNIPEAYKQILSKGYWYQEYVSNGGEQNSYFDNWKNKFVKDEQNFLGRIVKWPFKKVSQANNVIEMAPRLAEYIASRQEGRSIETSMLDAARVTTNFKAGGDTTKFLNRNGGIFLNASVQGLVQNVRNVREARANGLKGWTNLATKCIIAGIPALILNNMVWDDDDDYKELADYVKDNYYIIAKYGDGKFIRIPKGRTIAVIQNAFTQVADSTTGNDKADLDRFLNLATSNLAPNNPIENNIFSPIIQVLSNKTWYGEDLVPQRLQSSPNKQQYDETTDSFSKWLGNKLNISPYKIHYLLDQYSGGVGDVVLPMMTPKAENGSDSIGGKVISPLIDKFTTDSVMNNKYVGDFYDVKDKATQKAHSIDATEKDTLMSKYLNSKNFYLNQLYAEKRAIQNSKLKDSEKYKKVREKQDEINKLAKQSIDEYKKVKINGSSATVGDITYRKDKNGEWTKVKDK